MGIDETFTIKETSGTLGIDDSITGGSLIAGAGGGISTNSKLTIDGGVLLATTTSKDPSHAIHAGGDILLKNTTLVDSLATDEISPSPNGIETNGKLHIENAFVQTGKITTTDGIFAREYAKADNLYVEQTVSDQRDDDGNYVAKAAVKALGSNRKDFVLDGRWRVIFDGNGGTLGKDAEFIYPVTSAQLVQFPAKQPVKDGYTFAGWFTSDSGGTKRDNFYKYTLGTEEKEDYYVSPQNFNNNWGLRARLYAHWTANTSGGSVLPVTPVQKPEIQPVSGGKTELSKDGSTLEITPDEGMEIGTVTVNGKEVTVKDGKITGLKTGDKVQVTFIAKAPSKAEADQKAAAMVKNLNLTVKTSRTANQNIKATVQMNRELAAAVKELKAAGYKVQYKFYRSIKKASAYERMLIKDAPWYVNTIGDKDTYYYYKVRLAVYDQDGKLIAQTALKQCKAGSRIWVK